MADLKDLKPLMRWEDAPPSEAKVVTLFGRKPYEEPPAPEKQEPAPDPMTIALAEELVEQAKKGILRGFMAICLHGEGEAAELSSVESTSFLDQDPRLIVGELQALSHELLSGLTGGEFEEDEE